MHHVNVIARFSQGELRCDVNVSVARIGADGQVEQEGTRCEVKKLNGVRWFEQLAQGRDPKKAANW